MSIANADEVDMVLRAPEGELVLGMTAFEEWEAKQLSQLSKKLSCYVDYTKSSEFKREHGTEPVKILLSTAHEPTRKVGKLLSKFSKATGIPTDAQTTGPMPNFLQ